MKAAFASTSILLALSFLAAGPLAAQASDGLPVDYELGEGSTLTVDCFVCELVHPTQPITGTFRLVRTSADGDPAEKFRVESILFKGEFFYQVRAVGTYTRNAGGFQTMDLEASLDETPAIVLSSGQEAIVAEFPAVDITVRRADPPDQTIFINSIHIVARPSTAPPTPLYRRGDADADGTTTIADAIRILNWQFAGGEEPSCADSADVDDNEEINISDPITLLGYLFLGGLPPAAPGPSSCGSSVTPVLGCASYPGC